MISKRIAKKRTNETIKPELLISLQEDGYVEEQGLNETVKNVNNFQEATKIINRYEEIIKTQIKKAIGYIGKQGELLKKFKDTENFFDNVCQSRSTICFKNSLYKFLKKYPLLKKSIIQSSYFKNNFKTNQGCLQRKSNFFCVDH